MFKKLKSNDSFKLNTKKSNVYYSIMLFIFVGLAFFSLSKPLLGEDDPILNTQQKTDISMRSMDTVSIENWEYDSKQNSMRVQLNFKQVNNTLMNDISFEAVEKINPAQLLPVKVVYKEAENYIVEINQVSPNFKVVALDIVNNSVEDSNYEIDINQFENTEETDQENAKESSKSIEVTLYADQRKVKKSAIKNKTKAEFALEIINAEQEKIREKIKEIDAAYIALKDEEKLIKQKMGDISKELKYLVDQEKEDAQSNISSMKDEIKNISDKEFLLESDKKILNEKVEKLELKKSDISK
ncbi:hypothetical protein [Bacillus sp. TE9122W]